MKIESIRIENYKVFRDVSLKDIPSNGPYVKRKILRYKRDARGKPFHFLDFANGSGYAINNEEDFHKPDKDLRREEQRVARDTLAIKGLGHFERFKAAYSFRQLIEAWHVSDFHVQAARGRKDASGVSGHLSASGDQMGYLWKQGFFTGADPL